MERTPPFEHRLIGQTLAGKYKLMEVRAGGAFGAVFRAEQSFCGQFVRPVAVKVSRQTGLNQETTPYLFGDAIMLAPSWRPATTTAGGISCKSSTWACCPNTRTAPTSRWSTSRGAAAVAHAGRRPRQRGHRPALASSKSAGRMALVHGQGAVHRDLKSDNILVDRRGVVRVVDFGLASYADRRLGFAPGAMGTFTYMAPETVLGRSTPASDVYSLGLLMYELFTGGGPHLTAPWCTDDQKDHRDEHYQLKRALRFPPPSEVQNEIRNDYRWLDALILRCLETDPARRIPDAGQLLAAVEACEAGEELPPPVAGNRCATAATAQSPTLTTHPGRRARRIRCSARCGGCWRARSTTQVIDRLDVHRPAEWAVIDRRAPGRCGRWDRRTWAAATCRRRGSAWSSCATPSGSRRCCAGGLRGGVVGSV